MAPTLTQRRLPLFYRCPAPAGGGKVRFSLEPVHERQAPGGGQRGAHRPHRLRLLDRHWRSRGQSPAGPGLRRAAAPQGRLQPGAGRSGVQGPVRPLPRGQRPGPEGGGQLRFPAPVGQGFLQLGGGDASHQHRRRFHPAQHAPGQGGNPERPGGLGRGRLRQYA